jgi:hypothetical protein
MQIAEYQFPRQSASKRASSWCRNSGSAALALAAGVRVSERMPKWNDATIFTLVKTQRKTFSGTIAARE